MTPPALTRPRSIGFLGFGKMGQAVARGLLGLGVAPSDIVVTPRPSNAAVIQRLGLRVVDDLNTGLDLLIVAVKPGVFHAAWAEMLAGRALVGRPVLLSCMARIGLDELGTTGATPARLMTTLSCAHGQGVGVWDSAPGEHLGFMVPLIEGMGAHRKARSERDFVDATVLSSLYGLTPELVYALETGLNHNGASRSMQELVLPVLLAALSDMERRRRDDPGLHPLSMTDAVSSPGGTTAAMRQTLYEAGLYATLARAVEAASTRAR